MAKQIQAIRGMNDILPTQSPVWQKVEAVLRASVASFGYSEIRTPIVENTDLFKRSIGEVTDIVEKEMYTFADRNGDSLTLRPEGTASTVRAGNEHGLLYNQEQRLWYMGPMFRHERPQKGRYRQFHQFGVEVYGIKSADIDAEVLMLSASLWQKLGLTEHVSLELNTLGDSDDAQPIVRRWWPSSNSIKTSWTKIASGACTATHCGCWTRKISKFRPCWPMLRR